MSCEPDVEADFAASWDMMLRFYDRFIADHDWAHLAQMRALVVQLRAHYDRELRAGQSMTTFVLSRSRVHGMRQDQPSISMSPGESSVAVSTHGFTRDERFTIAYGEDLDPRLLELLDAFVNTPLS